MAEITKVVVSKGVTVSVGKYESVRIDAQVEVRGDDGEDPDMLFDIGFEAIDERINAQIGEIQEIVTDESVFKTAEPDPKPKKRSSRKR